jgi:AraC-like DNA-binding protein
LTMMSKQLSIPVPYLSRVINESFNLNFCDFVNKYRIEESKIFLKEIPKTKMTVLEIAYKVGFNTKSAFYEAFKKRTGLTPKEFVKNHSLQ